MRPAEILVAVLTCVVIALLVKGADADEPPPPITARDLALNDARAYALVTQPDVVPCYQVREQGRTRVCITETEWRRQHAEDVTQVEVPND